MLRNAQIKTRSQLLHYLKDFQLFAKHRLFLIIFLLVSTSLTDGIGLLMLIPLLHLTGLNQSSAEPTVINNTIEYAFNAIHLPLTLTSILIIYVILITIRSLLLYFRETQLTEIRLSFVDHIRLRLYQSIGNANWLHLSKKRTSDLTHVLNSDINRVAQGTYAALQISIGSGIIIIYLFVAFQLSLAMTLITLVIGCLLLLLLRPLIKRARQQGELLGQENKRIFATTSDFLEGIKLAKSYSLEERYFQSFKKATQALRSQKIAFTRSNTSANMLYQIGAAIALSILFYLAINVLKIPSAELLVLAFIFSRLLPQLSQLQRHYQQIVHMLPAYTSAMKIQQQFDYASEYISHNDSWTPTLNQRITLKELSFRYNKESSNNTLEGISLSLPARNTLGIIGESGSGKSTLADIFAGLLSPDTGSIHIDQHLLNQEKLHTWRKSVAYVPQETFLFHDSIRNNLLWAKPDASDKELGNALELAAAKHFVSQLPEGMDTIIGDRGIRLSGGERQRIALARALLSKPLLLILDEATSALDTKNEKRIQQAIDSLHGELTIIIIAHRLSTLEHADQIIEIQTGKITTKSNHQ